MDIQYVKCYDMSGYNITQLFSKEIKGNFFVMNLGLCLYAHIICGIVILIFLPLLFLVECWILCDEVMVEQKSIDLKLAANKLKDSEILN